MPQNFCNGSDDNCNGEVDEPSAVDAIIWYADTDGDGFGFRGNAIPACAQPEGFVADNTDCNDSNVDININAVEVCNNEDDDCDGFVDEGSDANAPAGSLTFFNDADGDGYGDPNIIISQCAMPSTYVSNDQDCDDANVDIYPNAIEYCNGLDDNCNGSVDESTAVNLTTYFMDTDGDGYGDATNVLNTCPYNQPLNTVEVSGDCSPNNTDVYPGAPEFCNGVDDTCNGDVDEGVGVNAPQGSPTWYYDLDGDGFGNLSNTILACEPPIGTVPIDNNYGADCNDTDPLIRPNALEYCNALDDDCDGTVDEDAVDISNYYLDLDGDGHGDVNTLVSVCPVLEPGGTFVPPAGASLDGETVMMQIRIYPPVPMNFAPQLLMKIAMDIQHMACCLRTSPSWYPDSDGDGYGNPSFVIQLCQQPQNYVGNPDDCNDTDYFVHPLDLSVHANDFEDDGVTPYVHRERCNGKVDLCENDLNGDMSPPIDETDVDGDFLSSVIWMWMFCSGQIKVLVL